VDDERFGRAATGDLATPITEGGFSQMPETTFSRVHSRAQAALGGSPIFALRRLQVNCNGESLVLSGRVATFYHKQLAQEVVRGATEGIEVVNSIHVD
jgi:hypothetical protein